MGLSSKQIELNLFSELAKWRWKQIIASGKSRYNCTDLHHSIIRDYFDNHSNSFEYRKLPLAKLINRAFLYTGPGSSIVRAKTATFFTRWIKQFFMVPRLKKFLEIRNRVKRYQLVEVLLSFLLRLLYRKPDSAIYRIRDPAVMQCGEQEEFEKLLSEFEAVATNSLTNRIRDLEKELRFLLTVVGDTSVIRCGEQEEFEKLLSEFEAVANEAGSFVHFLLFSIHRTFKKSSKRLGVVLYQIDLLKDNIMKFLNLLPFNMTCIPPKTSVVDSLLIVDSLIRDLEDLMKRENNGIAEAEDQIRALHQELISLQSSIKDFGSPQPSQIGELKEPLMQMGDLAHEAEYLIVSCFNGEAPCWYLISRLTRVNHNIEHIRAKIQEITKKHKAGGLLVPKYFNSNLSLSVKKNIEVYDDTIVFEDIETYILDQLVGRGASRQVVSIFGMPGLGKTTFAKRMYNHPLVIERFERRSWCVISQTYDRHRVLTDILINLTSEYRRDRALNMDEERLIVLIHQKLMGRRYLIAMDDIWDSNVWDDLQRSFPDEGNGSRILFTTRNQNVAPPNSLLNTLPLLTLDQCWELLEKKVFGNESCPLELQGIGKKIAANCCGLPLTVVVIAGILSTMDKKEQTWEELGGNTASHIFYGGDNSVMQILELSYMYLPDFLKPCFLYFGIFGGGTEITIGDLLRLWISEGFVAKEEGKRIENVAEEYLIKLIDKCLVMIGRRRSDGGVKTCFIHDLLHDLCLKLCVEENFLQFVDRDDYSIYKKGQRIQVRFIDDRSSSWSCCQHVRSFRSLFHRLPFYIRDMRLLRVLHSDFGIYYEEILFGTEYLVNLRYLVIDDLPASIGSLVNLEYLGLENFIRIIHLPQPILRMGKLRYIKVKPISAIYGQDCSSSQTSNLECLSGIRIREDRDVEMLKCSPYLRKLKCRYIQSSIEENESCLDLHFLTQLESLSIEGITRNLGISFPSNIKKLTLSFCDFAWEKMSIIGRLGDLEVLKLSDFYHFSEGIWDTTEDEFQKLKFLKLERVRNLIQWNVTSSQYFPNLQRLFLIDCDSLQEIPLEIGEIATLEMLEIRGVFLDSLVESAKSIKDHQREMENEALCVIFIDCAVLDSEEQED